jgi:hypothetical protein
MELRLNFAAFWSVPFFGRAAVVALDCHVAGR